MFRNEQDCTSGEGGAKTCNLRFDELQTVCPKRVDFPCPEADPQLVHFADARNEDPRKCKGFVFRNGISCWLA